MEIEINGVKYKKIEHQSYKMSKTMSKVLMVSAMFGGLDGISGTTRKRPTVDLEKEYGLIQQKKSNLSRNDRDWVIRQFERQYERVL